ncbi:MAG: hypothetical protein ABI651_02205 [Verrucomicrobiota bacterium]
MCNIKRYLRNLAVVLALAAFQSGTLQAQITLDPAWRVSPDTSKPGFIWNYFSNGDGANTGNSIDRAERDLAGQATDATGALLPNLGDPNAFGTAIAASAPANPTNGLLHFEIPGVINLSKADGGAAGFVTPDELEPGLNSNESTDGQAAEILTYITLAAGTNVMVVNSDDGFQTSSGPNPVDAFGKVTLGEFNSGRGASATGTGTVFTVVVPQAGTYPFRTVWENGGGDSNIEWFTAKPDGTLILVNDIANGGVPAYRALAAATPLPPYVKFVTPLAVPRQVEQSRRNVTMVLADGSTAVDDNSVTLTIDGQSTPVTKQRQGNLLTVDTGVLPGLHLAGEAHTGVLTFKDSTGAYSRTQQWTFYNLENLILPASPVTGENFDSYPESTSPADTVPPGWVATNYTFRETPGWDLTDITSDAFLDMVIISTNSVFPLEDEVLLNDTTQTINGIPLTNGWMSGNLLFSASDGRVKADPDGIRVGQIRFVVTKPFNLSTVTNPVLTFSSAARLSSGNIGEQMTVEYSIDGGTNWLPVIYMQNAATVKLSSDGSYDALAMFNNTNSSWMPRWPTPGVGPLGGSFAAMIAAPISQALAPYITTRNDGVAARKVEAIRLTQASKQSDVRLRLTHIGECGWEWGIDNIAFYDISPTSAPPPPGQPKITGITSSGGKITIQWTGGGTLESTTSLTSSVWTSTGNSSGTFSEPQPATGNKFYRVKM